MIFAILQPASLVGLLLAFGLGVAVRAMVQVVLTQRILHHRVGSGLPQPRRDVDPIGAIAAVLGGTGWGRDAPVPDPGWLRGRTGSRLAVLVAGPLAVIGLGLLVLLLHRAVYPGSRIVSPLYASDVLRGVTGPAGEQVLVSAGVGLLCFGVLAFLPLPPLDGWRLLWLGIREPGQGARRVRFWLQERNLGVLLLLVLLVFPIGSRVPPLLRLLDLVVNPLMGLVAA